MKWHLIYSILAAASLLAQSQISGRTQIKDIDFSGADATKPLKTGATLPGSCSAGEMFLQLTGGAGYAYTCATNNQWSLISANSGNSSGSLLLDGLQVRRLDSTKLEIGGTCSGTNPCNVRIGTTTHQFSTPATVTLEGGSGALYVYVSPTGTLTAGHVMTVSCTGACVSQSGVMNFPPDSLPLATWTADNGTWEASGVDFRAFLAAPYLLPGLGLTLEISGGGAAQFAVDPALLPVRSSVPATSTSSCTAGNWALTDTHLYFCVAGDTWKRMELTSW